MRSEIVSSLNRAEIGKPLSNTPRHSANLWTTYQLPWNADVGAGAQFVGSRLSPTAQPNARTAPGYWLFDAMAAYHPTKHLTLRVNAYNLGNQEYIESLSGAHFIPGAGRSAIAAAEFKF
jgi:catecholate siderophore receptor